MERTAGQRIAGNLSWLGLQELIGRLIGFFMLIYLARLLSPADYGSLNICMALMAILSLLVRAGTGSRATRLTARDAAAIPGIHSDVAGLRIVIAVVLIISIALLCVPLGSLLSVPPQLLLLGSALLVRPALTVAWAFRGLDNMRPIALSGAAERLLVLVGLLLLVHGSNLDMYIVMLLEIAGAIIVVWWLRLSLYRNLGSQLQIRFNYRRWGSMVRESWAVSMATIIGSLYRHGDALLLGALAGSATAAVYLVGQKIMLTLVLLPAMVGKASFPSTSRALHQDMAAAVSLQAQLLRLSLVVLLPTTALIILFAEPLVQLLFGDQYMVAVGILQILSLTLPFFAFSIFQENLLLAAPRVRVLLWSRVTSSTIHMLLAALLIPHYGASGAAIGCLAGQVIFSVTTAICWRRNYRLMPIDKSFLAPFAATGAAVAVFMLLAANSPWLGAGLGALVYLTLVLVWKGIRPAEFITLISYLRETSLRGRKPL